MTDTYVPRYPEALRAAVEDLLTAMRDAEGPFDDKVQAVLTKHVDVDPRWIQISAGLLSLRFDRRGPI